MGEKKKNRVQKAIDRIFYQLTKNDAKKLYKDKVKQLKEDGIEVTDEMKKELIHKYVNECSKEAKGKAKRRGLVVGIFGLGALAGIGGTLALNPAVDGVTENKPKKQIEINLDEVEEPIVFTGSYDKVNSFKQEIKDSVISQDARKKAQDAVDNAQNSEEVLDIVKSVIAEQWNVVSDEKIENISLRKTEETTILYEDKAENGDNIIRFREFTSAKSLSEEGKKTLRNNTMIQVRIQTEDGEYYIQMTPQYEKYVTVYGESEAVSEYKDNFIVQSGIAKLTHNGIKMGIAKGNEESNSWAVNDGYKNDFTEDLAIYYNDQMIKMQNNYMTSQSQYKQEEMMQE